MQSEVLDDKRPLASIPLQTFLFFDLMFNHLYFALEIIIFIYKGYGLFYPTTLIGVDVFLQFLFAFTQYSRIELGSIGNKTESPSQILWFLLLWIPCVFFYIYFLILQTYVILLEVIINIIGIIFVMFELIFSLFAFLTFKNYEKTQ